MRTVVSVLLAALAASFAGAASPRERISIDDGWRFTKGDPPGNITPLLYDVRPSVATRRDDRPADAKPREAEKLADSEQPLLKPWILPTGNAFISDPARRHPRPKGNWNGDVAYVRPDFDDSGWQRVNLPHDWAIEGPWLEKGPYGGMGRLPTAGVGWYRRKLHVPAGDQGKRIYLDVDGAMSYAAVWLDGHLVGGWPYGYSSWRVDLTPYISCGGENELAIRLDNPPDSSRWYPGAGIYRNVWLVETQRVHVAHWGTQVITRDVSPASAIVNLAVAVENDSRRAANITVATTIFVLDEGGRISGDAVALIAPVDAQVAAGSSSTVTGSVTVRNPRLWGPPPQQRPNRYVAVTTVREHGTRVDEYWTDFGIRDIRFDANRGLLVNGERIQIHGVNDHHDLGPLGAAFNVRAAQRQLEILRDMGCNAIRTSHNPPAPELLELTDRMGFLVLDEAFDVWYREKTPLDFHLIFPDWHEQDLRAMVRRDRNHPSVVLWSIGNEVGEQYTGGQGAAVARELCDIVHEEDPTRPATTAMNYAKPDMPLPREVDVIGLNYQGEGIRDTPEFAGTNRIRTKPQYPAFHARFPDKAIISTETASAFSSRGVYVFPVTRQISSPVRDGRGGDSRVHQVSAYELYAVDFGSSADKVFRSLDSHSYVAGEFVWSGWDYLGEPTPYFSSRSSYCGIIDLAGFRKDRFYLYQAHWRPDFPMAHILPHWTWPGRVGRVTPVHVFTSGDEAELFLNGRSLGRKRKEAPDPYRLRWDDVVYEPGVLRVVAYREGHPWATDTVMTAGAPFGLDARPDRAEIAADGSDLSFVTVRVVDKAGNLVPRADTHLTFTVAGPGELVAAANGDPTSFEPFQAPEHDAFNGLCLAIVRAKGRGRIRLTVTADGLRSAVAVIEASGT